MMRGLRRSSLNERNRREEDWEELERGFGDGVVVIEGVVVLVVLEEQERGWWGV
jgi:hypothetical protein